MTTWYVPPEQFNEIDVDMIDSAAKHGVSKSDALYVMNNATARRVLREDPPKVLYVGFDSEGRPREVITDLSQTTGKPVIFHADTLTPALYEFL